MDTYQTIESIATGLYKEKGSKFISYAHPATNEFQIRQILGEIKKEHFTARHHCYAWRLGPESILFRANDDGEPSSTAGKPILGQIVSRELTDLIVIVVRYFGGTLLGTSGLINAYKTAAADALSKAQIITKKIEINYRLSFAYELTTQVMNLIKSENLHLISSDFNNEVCLTVAVCKSETSQIENMMRKMFGLSFIKIEKLNS